MRPDNEPLDRAAVSRSPARSEDRLPRLQSARFAGEAPDLKTIVVEADVDGVLTGTPLTSGGQLTVHGVEQFSPLSSNSPYLR